MDWLRIGAFALLIFYHIGMFFVHWPCHVKTAAPQEWLAIPMLATNAWRLALLFVVSGFASAAILTRAPRLGAFMSDRSKRLLIPLVFAAILIIPPQPWVELQFLHGYTRDYVSFWLNDYFRFGELNGLVMPTWQHLWFVVYLWFYTALLALLLAILPQRAKAGMARLTDRALAGPLILIVPIALLWLHLALIWPGHSETHALFDDGPAHRVYFTAFAFGFFLWTAQSAWAAIRRWWKVAAAFALAAYGVVATVEFVYPGNTVPPPWVLAIFGPARLVQGWAAIVALIGIADRYWNRDHPWRAMLVEAVFPFYIVHQTIIVLTGWWLLPFGLHPLAELAILVAATVAGCLVFYFIGREIGLLRPLIGLRARVAKPLPSARGEAKT